MMKRHSLLLLSLLMVTTMHAQKTRPDAFPPIPDTLAPKVVNMATNLDEMASWDRYPTYEVYIEMMERFVQNYPTLCRLDTIGTLGAEPPHSLAGHHRHRRHQWPSRIFL